MKINKAKIIKKIESERELNKRGPVTFSLNLSLYKKFKAACERESLPASQVIEKVMEEFLDE